MKALISKNIVLSDKIFDGAVLHQDGKITAIVTKDKIPSQSEKHDVGSLMVLPGLVDTHVHINEPGRTDWEGFNSATQSAGAGGITTVVDMPLNCIPVTTSVAALNQKLHSLQGKLWVDCGFHGGVVPDNTQDLEPMAKAGVKSFKAFMIDSGIPEFEYATPQDLAKAMPILAKTNSLLLVHAEVSDKHSHDQTGQRYLDFLQTRPSSMENRAIELIIELSKQTNCPVHIVHLSSAEAVPLIAKARKDGVRITAETCPHYLTIEAEHIPDGDGRFKCMPPIRDHNNRELLWQGLLDGHIDFIVSDHSPCTPALKKLESKNLRDAWGGISSLQLGLPLIWTEMRQRHIPINKLARWMATNPAKSVGLSHKKGQLSAGFDADFVVFDPNKEFTITKNMILHKHKETPYENRQCHGYIHETWLRGERIFANQTFDTNPRGEIIL